MKIEEFLEKLKQLTEELEEVVYKIENNTSDGIKKAQEVMKKVQEIMPDWFFFIEQTELGDKQQILEILKDIMQGLEAEDSVYLADALCFGLRELALEYKNVIEEALYGE